MEEAPVLPAEVLESAMELSSDPPDLNSASREVLETSGLFTDYQIRQLINYRDIYGPIFSIHELAVVPGFHPSLIRKIAPQTQLLTGRQHHLPRKRKWWLLIQTGGDICKGNPAHSGTPLKTCLRIRTEQKPGLSLAATYQKDAGELYFPKGRPEFLSGYLSYSGNGICRQLVAGTFKIHHGTGLVNGTGLMHTPDLYLENPPMPSRLQPYRSVTESAYERGIASRFAAGRTEVTCWVSHRCLDLSVAHLNNQTDWMEHVRESGFHRTGSEIGGRDLLYRIHSGLQCILRLDRFTGGLLTGWEMTGLTQPGIDSLQGMLPPEGLIQHHPTLSIYSQWRGTGWSLLGELALSGNGAAALLAGANIRFTDFLRGQLLIHRYGNHFRGAYPAAYSAGSRMAGEQGLALHIWAEPGNHLEASFTIELFHFTSPRHQLLLPGSVYKFCFSLGNPATSDSGWRIRWKRKISHSMPAVPGGTGIRPVSAAGIDRVELLWHFKHLEYLRCRYRLIGTFLHQEQVSNSGLAASMEAGVRAGKQIQFRMQTVVFRVGSWENRIYLYQPGLYYSFNFPVYNGTGHRTSLIFNWKPVNRLTVSASITSTLRKERNGNGTRAEVQLRYTR